MMEDISILNRSEIFRETNFRTKFPETIKNKVQNVTDPVINDLKAESWEHFSHYLNCQGLDHEANMLVLSSKHHYYYEQSELESVTILLNLKKLNHIINLDRFLASIYNIISPKTNFVGHFTDWKIKLNGGFTSRMYKGFINILDDRTDTEIDKNDVSRRLVSNGFRVIDMSENNGFTYFRSQINRKSDN